MSRRARRTAHPAAHLAAALAVLALAGCGSTDPAPGADPAPGTGPVRGAAVAASTGDIPGTGSTESTGSTEGTGTDPAAQTTATPATARTVTSLTSFTSPTGNIACFLAPVQGASPYARCDLSEVTWEQAPAPRAGCAGDWGGAGGRGIVGVGGGEAGLVCAQTDTAIDPAAPALAYGDSITLGDITCTVQRDTGMSCDNAATGHGFTASRAGLSLR